MAWNDVKVDGPPALDETDWNGMVAAVAQVAGQIGGTAASPTVTGITETSGPTALVIGTITDGQYLKRSGSTLISGTGGSGGASFWTALTLTTDFSGTIPSTSTITMATDQTGNIKVGGAIKYTTGGTLYYGVVTALTSVLMTIAGPPLTTGAAGITTLSYGDNSRVMETVIGIPGYFEEASYTTAPYMLESLMFLRYGIPWHQPPAYLVRFTVQNGVADTGTAPIVNMGVGAAGSPAFVSTSNTNKGLSLPANTTFTSTVVDINPSNYAITEGQYIELEITKGTDTVKAQNLTVVGVFVFP